MFRVFGNQKAKSKWNRGLVSRHGIESLEQRRLMVADLGALVDAVGAQPPAVVAPEPPQDQGQHHDQPGTESEALQQALRQLQTDHGIIDLERSIACDAVEEARQRLEEAQKELEKAERAANRSDQILYQQYRRRVMKLGRQRSLAYRELLGVRREIRNLVNEKQENNELFDPDDPSEVRIRDNLNARIDERLGDAIGREQDAEAEYERLKAEFNELTSLGPRSERRDEAVRRQRAMLQRRVIEAQSAVDQARRNLESLEQACRLLALELRYNEHNQRSVAREQGAAEQREQVLAENQPQPNDSPEEQIGKADRLEQQADQDISDNNDQGIGGIYAEAQARAARAERLAGEAAEREQEARRRAQQHQDKANSGPDQDGALAEQFDQENPNSNEQLTEKQKADRQRATEAGRAREANREADEAAHQRQQEECAAEVSRRQVEFMDQEKAAERQRLQDAQQLKRDAQQLRQDALQQLDEEEQAAVNARREELERERERLEQERNRPCVLELRIDVELGGSPDLDGVTGRDVRRRLAAALRGSNNDMLSSLGTALGFEQSQTAFQELAGLGASTVVGGVIDSLSIGLSGSPIIGPLVGTGIQAVGRPIIDMISDGALQLAGWTEDQLTGEQFTMNGTSVSGTASTVVNQETGEHVTEINFRYRQSPGDDPKQVKVIIAGSIGFIRD